LKLLQALGLALVLGLPVAAVAAERPNVLLILADDLGFSDLGCYGGEIETPNLDALAQNGLRFTQFYNTARCWPTRAALLTGYYAQQVRRDELPGVPRGKRPQWARLLPEMLGQFGYRSYHSGKWHIDGSPLAGGFHRSYNLRDHGRLFSPRVHYEDDRKLPPVKAGAGYYATTAIADHAITCLKEHAEKHREKPFFHYLAFTAPHFPLHALPEDIDRYRERYRVGWTAVRESRWRRLQAKGIVRGSLSAVERDVGPPYHFPDALEKLGPGEVNRPLPWSDLTDEQREFQSTKMAIHAAMVDRMDRAIGRVLDQLRAMKAFEDTLVVFLSDNGASAEIMVRDDGHDPSAPPGSAATHLCLGPGWSTTSNTPFRRHKTWVHEGGIATPFIAHWPRGITARDELRHTPGHVIDLVPTILATVRPSGVWGNPRAPSPPGRSLTSVFKTDGSVERHSFWWSHEGNRAIRVGSWKLVAGGETGPWELYDLSTDRMETMDLSGQRTEKVVELAAEWTREMNNFQDVATRDAKRPRTDPARVKKLVLPGESFLVDGRPAFVMMPTEEKRRDPQPWIFYAPTLPGYPDPHEKWMHERFLEAGVAVAGIDVDESYGSPAGRKLFTAFYRQVTTKRGFSPRPCLLGRSRGGLWTSSWAIENPDKVAGIAGMYPVFDLRTYPGLARAAPAYGLTTEELEKQLAMHNPIQRIDVLAEARVPAFFIHGDQDTVVPLEANSNAFVRRYTARGAESSVRLRVVKGQGHNYWPGFFRCRELVDFAISRARAGEVKP